MTDPKTVGEVLARIQELRLAEAVYQELVDHLTPLISTDTHEPVKGIASPFHPDGVVPEEVVINVQHELLERLEVLHKQVAVLNGKSISGAKAPAKKKAPLRKTKRRKASVRKDKKEDNA